jgi:hypothetical protein
MDLDLGMAREVQARVLRGDEADLAEHLRRGKVALVAGGPRVAHAAADRAAGLGRDHHDPLLGLGHPGLHSIHELDAARRVEFGQIKLRQPRDFAAFHDLQGRPSRNSMQRMAAWMPEPAATAT